MSTITGTEFWNIIICLGALQGFILSVLLFLSKKGNKLSNRLLAVLIFLLALTSTNLYIIESDFYDEYALVQILQQVLPLVITLPVGPLIYFYVRSLSQTDFHMHKKQWWHFSPVIIDLIPRMIVWVFIIGLLTGIVQEEDGRGWGDFIDTYNTYSDLPRWLSITLYLLLTKHFLKKCIAAKDGEVDAQTSTQEKMNWIHQFLNAFLAFQFIWLLFLIPYLIPSTRGYLLDNMSYYPIYIPLAVLVYWLGFKGYLQTQLSKTEPIVKDFPIQPGPLKVVNPSLSFSDEEVTHYTTLLKKSMEEDKLYLESSLNLQSVSTHTNIAQKTISYILNNYHNKSFNEFVNEYRIQEVKKRLLEKDKDHLTIYGIALDCGFNSQATFQRAFKSITGVSPKEYLSIQSRKLA